MIGLFLAASLPLLDAYDMPGADLPGPTPSGGEELLCKLKRAVNLRDMFGIHKWSSPKVFTPNPKVTCAVVSSSGVLRAGEFGQDIDMADRVFRFNQAETEGWEKYVGYRKDIYVWNDIAPISKAGDNWVTTPGVTYLQFLKFDSELEKAKKLREENDEEGVTFLMAWPNNMESSMRWFMENTYPKEWFPKTVTSMFHTNETQDADEDELKQRFAPSTGVMGMVLALSMCGEVRTYGMAASKAEFDNTLPYHYWDENAKGGANAHTNNFHITFSAEKDLWRRLSNTPEAVIDATAAAIIPGFSRVDCSAHDDSGLPPELDISPFGSIISFRGGQNGKHCTDKGDDGVECSAESVGDMEKFILVYAGDNKVALVGPKKNEYCSLDSEDDSIMKCNRDRVGGPREKWTMANEGQDLKQINRKFSLKGGDDGLQYCSDTGTSIQCNRATAQACEHFWLEVTLDTSLTGLSEADVLAAAATALQGREAEPAGGDTAAVARLLALTAGAAAAISLVVGFRRRFWLTSPVIEMHEEAGEIQTSDESGKLLLCEFQDSRAVLLDSALARDGN